jgi:hypothetical protein
MRRPSSTTEAAVSSQLVSMARIRVIEITTYQAIPVIQNYQPEQ